MLHLNTRSCQTLPALQFRFAGMMQYDGELHLPKHFLVGVNRHCLCPRHSQTAVQSIMMTELFVAQGCSLRPYSPRSNFRHQSPVRVTCHCSTAGATAADRARQRAVRGGHWLARVCLQREPEDWWAQAAVGLAAFGCFTSRWRLCGAQVQQHAGWMVSWASSP